MSRIASRFCIYAGFPPGCFRPKLNYTLPQNFRPDGLKARSSPAQVLLSPFEPHSSYQLYLFQLRSIETGFAAMGNQQLHSRFGTTWQAFVLSFLVFSLSQSPIVHAQQPFMPVETARALSGSTLEGNVLEKRQGCISNFFSCSGVGAAFSDVCCQYGYTCALDQNNQPACCPVKCVNDNSYIVVIGEAH